MEIEINYKYGSVKKLKAKVYKDQNGSIIPDKYDYVRPGQYLIEPQDVYKDWKRDDYYKNSCIHVPTYIVQTLSKSGVLLDHYVMFDHLGKPFGVVDDASHYCGGLYGNINSMPDTEYQRLMANDWKLLRNVVELTIHEYAGCQQVNENKLPKKFIHGSDVGYLHKTCLIRDADD